MRPWFTSPRRAAKSQSASPRRGRVARTSHRTGALGRSLPAAVVVALLLAALAPASALAAAPVADDASDQTSENTPLIVYLYADDTDGDPLTYAIVTPPAHGDLDDCSSGSCTYTPDPGYVGDDSFTWKANDGEFDSNIAVFSITVAANTAPDAYGESRETQTDTPFGFVPLRVRRRGEPADLHDRHAAGTRRPRRLQLGLLHLHARSGLRRRRQLHLEGERRRVRLEHRDLLDHGGTGSHRDHFDRSAHEDRDEPEPELRGKPRCLTARRSSSEPPRAGPCWSSMARCTALRRSRPAPTRRRGRRGRSSARPRPPERARTPSPRTIVTIVDAGTTGVRVTQTDSYVDGSESYRTSIAITDLSGNPHEPAALPGGRLLPAEQRPRVRASWTRPPGRSPAGPVSTMARAARSRGRASSSGSHCLRAAMPTRRATPRSGAGSEARSPSRTRVNATCSRTTARA